MSDNSVFIGASEWLRAHIGYDRDQSKIFVLRRIGCACQRSGDGVRVTQVCYAHSDIVKGRNAASYKVTVLS